MFYVGSFVFFREISISESLACQFWVKNPDILRLIASLLLANQNRESRGSMTCVVEFSDRETPDEKRKQKTPHEIILEACHVVRKRIEMFLLDLFPYKVI